MTNPTSLVCALSDLNARHDFIKTFKMLGRVAAIKHRESEDIADYCSTMTQGFKREQGSSPTRWFHYETSSQGTWLLSTLLTDLKEHWMFARGWQTQKWKSVSEGPKSASVKPDDASDIMTLWIEKTTTALGARKVANNGSNQWLESKFPFFECWSDQKRRHLFINTGRYWSHI